MSDNSYDTTFGPSTPGALNLISGKTRRLRGRPDDRQPVTDAARPRCARRNSNGVGTVFDDPDPAYDDCSDNSHTSTNPVGVMTGKNVGDLLNAKNVTWGWFQGGFAPTSTNTAGYAVCGATHTNIGGTSVGRLQRRTTTRSSTTSRRRTRTTCRRPRRRRSGTPTRPTTSTT